MIFNDIIKFLTHDDTGGLKLNNYVHGPSKIANKHLQTLLYSDLKFEDHFFNKLIKLN